VSVCRCVCVCVFVLGDGTTVEEAGRLRLGSRICYYGISLTMLYSSSSEIHFGGSGGGGGGGGVGRGGFLLLLLLLLLILRYLAYYVVQWQDPLWGSGRFQRSQSRKRFADARERSFIGTQFNLFAVTSLRSLHCSLAQSGADGECQWCCIFLV
jgi:hypothetical protein